MSRIWFDEASGQLGIEKFGTFAPGVLSLEIEGEWLRLVPPAGKVPFAAPWGVVANQAGETFASQAEAEAYLAGELAKGGDLTDLVAAYILAKN